MSEAIPEMVERVARALCLDRDANDQSGGPHPGGQWLEPGEHWWTGYATFASAAIEAMREPAEAMQVAGASIDVATAYTLEGNGRCLTPALVWRAMIDAALSRP